MIVGIDEVGRGCWAGPLVAAAVVIEAPISGLKDSKKLSRRQRELLVYDIELWALAIGIGWVEAIEIDKIGLTSSVRLAMKRALDKIDLPYDEIIIDGNYNFFPDNSLSRAVIAADASVPQVSAASVIAKVARDRWMISEADKKYPQYHFAKHVGYGTRLHVDMLKQYGACDIHRKSYRPIAALTN